VACCKRDGGLSTSGIATPAVLAELLHAGRVLFLPGLETLRKGWRGGKEGRRQAAAATEDGHAPALKQEGVEAGVGISKPHPAQAWGCPS